MPRQATCHIRRDRRADGSITYALRVSYDGEKHTVQLGNSNDGWDEVRVEEARRTTAAQIQLGQWRPPLPEELDDEPSIRELATRNLQQREDSGLAPTTVAKVKSHWERHLLPFFGEHRPSEITVALVDAYRDHKRAENRRIRQASAAGSPIRDPETGARVRPLANDTINATLRLLASLLDVAVDREWVGRNVAKGPRRREPVRRQQGDALDHRELDVLLEAATDLDRPRYNPGTEERAAEIKRLRTASQTWAQIAAEVGIAESTAIYLYNRPEAPTARGYPGGRRAIVAMLGLAGLRASEVCALNDSHVRLGAGKISVRDAKTPAGKREVDIHGRLHDELAAYRGGREHLADGCAFPTATGGRRDKDNVNKRVIQPVVERANELLGERGEPPIVKRVTPHTLRRTYITLMLTAGHDPAYVMNQAGHKNARTTLEIYARVISRPDRDQLRDEVRSFMGGTPDGALVESDREVHH